MINPGTFDKRVSIYKPAGAYDKNGQPIDFIDTGNKAWCSIEPANGKDVYKSGLTMAQMSHTIRMHWRADITSANELRYKGRRFQIVAPPLNAGEANETLELLCKERIAYADSGLNDNSGFDYGGL